MPTYIVNKNTDDKNRHEVHEIRPTKCRRLPAEHNRVDVGWHSDCHGALKAAEDLGYKPADGCGHCSPDCHKG